jgi:hypothetical protein
MKPITTMTIIDYYYPKMMDIVPKHTWDQEEEEFMIKQITKTRRTLREIVEESRLRQLRQVDKDGRQILCIVRTQKELSNWELPHMELPLYMVLPHWELPHWTQEVWLPLRLRGVSFANPQ